MPSAAPSLREHHSVDNKRPTAITVTVVMATSPSPSRPAISRSVGGVQQIITSQMETNRAARPARGVSSGPGPAALTTSRCGLLGTIRRDGTTLGRERRWTPDCRVGDFRTTTTAGTRRRVRRPSPPDNDVTGSDRMEAVRRGDAHSSSKLCTGSRCLDGLST